MEIGADDGEITPAELLARRAISGGGFLDERPARALGSLQAHAG
jgi:hypothetical protein